MYEPERPVPSIIQEIVIYDKPNIRNNTNPYVFVKTDKRILQSQKTEDVNQAQTYITSIKVENTESVNEDVGDTSAEQGDSKVGMKLLREHNDTNSGADSEPDDLSGNPILLKKSEQEDPVSKQMPFKKPRGRPKKSSTSPRKSNNGEKPVEESHIESGLPRRGRPRKSVSENVNDTVNEKKDVVQPKKRGRKRKIHNEAENQSKKEQRNVEGNRDVEAEIESMFNAVEEAENANQNQENDDLYDSEDSRQEWIPEEYVEYKQQHLRKMNKKTFPCKFCKVEFSSYYGVRKHRALEHNDVGKDKKESTYQDSGLDDAEMCSSDEGADNAGSDSESLVEWMPDDYAQYKMKHTQDKMKRNHWFRCKICCAVFSNYYKLSKHKYEHNFKPNPYQCNQCSEKFKDIDQLMAHIRVHQGKVPYQCHKCDKGYTTKEDLEEHLQVHVLKRKPMVKRFKCDVCSKEFSKLCDLERHTRVHTGEKPCECSICHKRFQQAHNLSKHLLIHLHVKPFQCEICNKKFGRIDVLNRHILTHSMEKPFKCNNCGRGFIREIQLVTHRQKHHPGKFAEEDI